MDAGGGPETTRLAVDGPAAPPRDNGELVFAEPWESRAFAMAVSLHESGVFEWQVFQDALIARIAASEADGGGRTYYACWLHALEDVLTGGGTMSAGELTARSRERAARPAGYDHGDHGHGP
jgi:nitrile hydratase accessory protein